MPLESWVTAESMEEEKAKGAPLLAEALAEAALAVGGRSWPWAGGDGGGRHWWSAGGASHGRAESRGASGGWSGRLAAGDTGGLWAE
ncbi:hypothetical protein GUJ93_ZPchr0010g9843 [Zizania palustris]|uniref:Uncharacterized protein n=1 Tax=Zizania palustris TaxID=103762 RepID=A0A8J6BRL8_ZIZPA|nr:hypothetical protein GUJ93_ZPchr0010g9843 [Zizania palustris]